jgi:Tfp pilus assembly protein PilV
MNRKTRTHLKHQRGIAMLVALLSLVLLAAIGMGLMFMADTENSVNNNYRDSQKAYFAARAGAESVRLQLSNAGTLNTAASNLTMPLTSAGTGIIYVKNPTAGEAIDPTSGTGATTAANPYLDDQLCWEKFTGLGALTPGTAGPCGSGTSPQPSQLLSTSTAFSAITLGTSPGVNGPDALPFKWVRITNKQNLMGTLNKTVDGTTSAANSGLQVCWDGGKEITIPAGTTCSAQVPAANPVWELTSLAVTPKVGQNPGSRRMVQMEVALNPPLVPPAPISTRTAVKLQGSFLLNAYDFCSCTCTTPSHGPQTCGGPGCNSSAHAIFTEDTVTQVGNGTTVSSYGTDPTGAASLQRQVWPDSLNLDTLINRYKAGAQPASFGSSCTGTANPLGIPPTYLNCGTQTNQTFGVFPSSLTGNSPVEPTSYTGGVTEYIPGSVKLTAGANGGGILIVDGDLEINGGLNWYGLILVRGQVSFTGGASGVNLFGAILAGQDVNASDQDTGQDTFGGSLNLHYDVRVEKDGRLCAPATSGDARDHVLGSIGENEEV